MGTAGEKREAVEFPRTHGCARGRRNVRDGTAADRYRCIGSGREPFGNDRAPCDPDCPGPGTRAGPADPIEGKD